MDYTDLLAYIRQIMRFIHIESKLLEKHRGISIPQLLTLNFLNKQKDFTSAHGAIGRFLVLSPSTVTGIVTRLEKKGVVARIPGGSDKRTSHVILTKKGKSLLEESLVWLEQKFEKQLQDRSESQELKLIQSFEEIIRFIKLREEKDLQEVIREIGE